jgi:tryptophan 2-C-methyltransferase
MLLLVNTNRMRPPIAPVGLDYLAGWLRRAGHRVELVDPGLADDPDAALAGALRDRRPALIGLSHRNVDDCFWPSATWFVPELCRTVERLRGLSDAPIVLGGVGFSIFARRVLELAGVEFGIRGDGESAMAALVEALRGRRPFEQVPGLVWREPLPGGGRVIRENPPAWPEAIDPPTQRDAVDNAAYFRRGGQIGLETKRGCPRQCAYCADPLAKGRSSRRRSPRAVADEVESLLRQGIDVLHLCDSEFNLPPRHALEVCDELIRRRLGGRVRWYAYLAVTPFDERLASRMAAAGCAGINFTSDAAHPAMLAAYGQTHTRADLAEAVRLCRRHGIAVMLDMLLGGPGETPETLAETIAAFKQLEPDCAGAALGLRLYPGTPVVQALTAAGPLETNPGLRRRYEGPVDLVRPTFYLSPDLGPRPARRVRELIGGDPRFFEPEAEPEDDPAGEAGRPRTADAGSGDHNYNANQALCNAIAAGARGAYWDILRRLRGKSS